MLSIASTIAGVATNAALAQSAASEPGQGAPFSEPEAIGDNDSSANEPEACDLREVPELQSALELELAGRVHEVRVEAVPCEDPIFYRVYAAGRVFIVSRTEHQESEARFLALSVAHLLDETAPPFEALPPSPPEPWADPRPVATDEDMARWFPSTRIFNPVERPITQGELRLGSVFGRGGRAGSGWLSVRSRFRRATLGVEVDGYVGSRGDDDFRKLSARAFLGWDLRGIGFEVDAGVITPRRAQGVNYAPAIGLRWRFGVVDAIEVNAAVQLALVDRTPVLSELRVWVIAPLTLRWRLDMGGGYARQTSLARMFFGAYRWLQGTGGAGSLALGARVGGTLLFRRDPCDGPCESDPTENSELRTFGGLHLELTLRRYF
ncbi:MAG: hypothetical protein AAF938_16775 [Myxococcota bacterium]